MSTAITEHWESMSRPVVHSESLRCPEVDGPLPVHYWTVADDGYIKCVRCGYSERLRDEA